MHLLWTIWGKHPEYDGESSGVRAELHSVVPFAQL